LWVNYPYVPLRDQNGYFLSFSSLVCSADVVMFDVGGVTILIFVCTCFSFPYLPVCILPQLLLSPHYLHANTLPRTSESLTNFDTRRRASVQVSISSWQRVACQSFCSFPTRLPGHKFQHRNTSYIKQMPRITMHMFAHLIYLNLVSLPQPCFRTLASFVTSTAF
jgi:hypothetical protein